MGWTRLEGSPLWRAAEAAYARNGGIYHSFDHPIDLYRSAERLGIPYCQSLDRAILAHDVIINLGPALNEIASADWLDMAMGEQDHLAREYILTTAEHSPRHPRNEMALLDLYSLSDPVISVQNSILLLDEAANKAAAENKQFDFDTWVRASAGYLSATASRIKADLIGYSGSDDHLWKLISEGAALHAQRLPDAIQDALSPQSLNFDPG